MDNFQTNYLTEVSLRIQHEGFTVCEEKDELLPIEWAGSRACNLNGVGVDTEIGASYADESI